MSREAWKLSDSTNPLPSSGQTAARGRSQVDQQEWPVTQGHWVPHKPPSPNAEPAFKWNMVKPFKVMLVKTA